MPRPRSRGASAAPRTSASRAPPRDCASGCSAARAEQLPLLREKLRQRAVHAARPARSTVGRRRRPHRATQGMRRRRPRRSAGRRQGEAVGLRALEDHVGQREQIRRPFEQLVAEFGCPRPPRHTDAAVGSAATVGRSRPPGRPDRVDRDDRRRPGRNSALISRRRPYASPAGARLSARGRDLGEVVVVVARAPRARAASLRLLRVRAHRLARAPVSGRSQPRTARTPRRSRPARRRRRSGARSAPPRCRSSTLSSGVSASGPASGHERFDRAGGQPRRATRHHPGAGDRLGRVHVKELERGSRDRRERVDLRAEVAQRLGATRRRPRSRRRCTRPPPARSSRPRRGSGTSGSGWKAQDPADRGDLVRHRGGPRASRRAAPRSCARSGRRARRRTARGPGRASSPAPSRRRRCPRRP